MKFLVITGGSSGIGLETAKLFLEKSYKVINLSRSKIPLENALQITTDLSKAEEINKALQKIQSDIGEASEIHYVHNAGLLLKDSIQEHNLDKMNESFQINVSSGAHLLEGLIPYMKKGSSAIFIGSTLSEKAVANTLSYSTAKHALIGLMRASCQDLMRSGVHTACVCPGFTDTQMLRKHVGESEEVLRQIASNVSYNRLIEPKEIAETIYFCTQNPVINGSVIHANLGQLES